MKKLFLLISAALIYSSVFPLAAQKLKYNSAVTGVCYAGNKVKRIYIPPPAEFFTKSGSKGGGSITVYYTGFTEQAQLAVEYAVKILERMLPSDTKFTLLASWETISTPGVLGNSSITGYAKGSEIDALNPNAYYPIALAEKIAGKSLNDDQLGDLTLRINSSITWYLGTDGNTPSTRYDLVTVVLHEICHGLGFFDSMDTDSNLGWYGFDSYPMIYDTFVENLNGKRLTDTLKFDNPSTDLAAEYTEGQLYFNGPLLRNFTDGSRAMLYAPPVWSGGSSIAHLDEDVTLRVNSLMTPFIDKGEAIHDPGKLTMSILGDIGWINTRVIHKPHVNTEEYLPEIEISARIQSDTLYNRDKVGMVYSLDNFVSEDTLYLSSPNSDETFSITINIPNYNTDLQYFFFVEDCFLRVHKFPSLSDSLHYEVFVGKDIVKPIISHTEIDYYLESIDSIYFNAKAVDKLGIDTVYIEYKLNDGLSEYIGLKAGTSDNYSSILNARPLSLKDVDSIQYRIFAVDSAQIQNTAVYPEDGYFAIRIEHIGTPRDNYSTDFSGSNNDFFNIGFQILKPAFFSKYGLHTKHPYESPEDNNKSIDYTAMLRDPFKFDASGLLISYNEVVLVEPGERGSVFGMDSFYDYVVLEGSTDFGKTWLYLADGYDSRLLKSWENLYNTSIEGQNSTAIGKESMLRKHSVFVRVSDSISAGDTLLLRFKLHSDPFANGWGWVIEDLDINPLIDDIEKIDHPTVKIFPNPGAGVIKISHDLQGNEYSKPFRFSVFNSVGNCIINDIASADSELLTDISKYPTGIYFIVLYRDDGIKTIKYTLIK